MGETTSQSGGNTSTTNGAGAGAGGAQGAAGGTGDAGAGKQDAAGSGSTALTAPAAEQKGAGDTSKGGEPAKTGQTAPEDITLKLPDGFQSGPEVEQFKGWAKEAGLKSEQAQRVFDLHLQSQRAQLQAIADQQAQQHKAWTEALPKDKEFGGAQYEQNRLIAQKAVTQFGSPELVKFLNESGLGNHPEVVRAFWKVGKALAEDRPSEAGNGASRGGGTDKEAALRAMYPNSPEMWGEPPRQKPGAGTP